MMTLKQCIELAHDMGLIGEVDYYELLEELDNLYEDQKALTNLRLYGEEEHNEGEDY